MAASPLVLHLASSRPEAETFRGFPILRRRDDDTLRWDVASQKGGAVRLRSSLAGGQSGGGAGGSGSAGRSHVVGTGVLQVVELQLQLADSHVLGGQLVLQPPQLVLLPEEHPQELQAEEEERRGEARLPQVRTLLPGPASAAEEEGEEWGRGRRRQNLTGSTTPQQQG